MKWLNMEVWDRCEVKFVVVDFWVKCVGRWRVIGRRWGIEII